MGRKHRAALARLTEAQAFAQLAGGELLEAEASVCELYERIRACDNARIPEWRHDLQVAASGLDDLARRLSAFRPEVVPAARFAPGLAPGELQTLDRALLRPLSLAQPPEALEARSVLMALDERWSATVAQLAAPGFTVGDLAVVDLLRLSTSLGVLASCLWDWQLFTLAPLSGQEEEGRAGARPRAAARFAVRACREHGLSRPRLARLLLLLSVEPPSVPPPDELLTDLDAAESWLEMEAERLVARWEKAGPRADGDRKSRHVKSA